MLTFSVAPDSRSSERRRRTGPPDRPRLVELRPRSTFNSPIPPLDEVGLAKWLDDHIVQNRRTLRPDPRVRDPRQGRVHGRPDRQSEVSEMRPGRR
jgi:hypothetical protein